MLSARRRLLGMLLILVIGSGALAFTKLAAWWVVVPPSAMLLGYMALLREAAKADAERRELARTPAWPARRRGTARRGLTRLAAPPVPAGSGPAPAPDAEVIDISASLGPAGEEFYDQYADAKLRAVGDLAERSADVGALGLPPRWSPSRQHSCIRGIHWRVRTFRTCGPRNEMFGWKVKGWSGASCRRG